MPPFARGTWMAGSSPAMTENTPVWKRVSAAALFDRDARRGDDALVGRRFAGDPRRHVLRRPADRPRVNFLEEVTRFGAAEPGIDFLVEAGDDRRRDSGRPGKAGP